MFRIGKTFRFAASHRLLGLPEDHKCHRLHGHNYAVTLVLTAEALPVDDLMVLDYGEMSPFRDWIYGNFDHRDLNDVLAVEMPTAEFLASYLGHVAILMFPAMVESVTVRETDDTFAEWVRR